MNRTTKHEIMNDTYPMPEHGWTCFHCGETLTTPGAAREHFGRTPDRQAGCVIKVEIGGERGLLTALRNAEDELAKYRQEEGDVHQSLREMQSRHSAALMSSEEAGYARGLRDARAMKEAK
jgi:hypothetical protein